MVCPCLCCPLHILTKIRKTRHGSGFCYKCALFFACLEGVGGDDLVGDTDKRLGVVLTDRVDDALHECKRLFMFLQIGVKIRAPHKGRALVGAVRLHEIPLLDEGVDGAIDVSLTQAVMILSSNEFI